METSSRKKEPAKVLIVDDIAVNVAILENIIEEEGHIPLCATSAKEALEIMRSNLPQVILSDITMPEMDGFEFCKIVKSSPATRDIPFIFITVADSREEKQAAFSAGAVDFIPKPFEPVEVAMRVNNQISSYRIKQEMENYNRMMHRMVTEQKRQMDREQANMLLALAKIAEKRSDNTGHLDRVGCNSRVLAQSLQLASKYEYVITDDFVDAIETAAKLHDLGDIMMSGEEIGRREKNFSKAEKAEDVREHVEAGAAILEEIGSNSNSRLLTMAIQIAKFHHANWDGSGYPEGVAGEEIPLAARIVSVVNDFDMMTQQEGLSPEESVRKIAEGAGSLYDSAIIPVFQKIVKQLHV